MSKTVGETIDMADDVSNSPGDPKAGGKIKTLVEAPSNVGREVLASPNTDTPIVPGNFHEFNGSQAKMYTTFDNRAEKIAAALGGKVPVKG